MVQNQKYVKEKNIPFTYTNFLANLLNNLPRKRKKHRNLMAVTLTPNFYLATFQDLPIAFCQPGLVDSSFHSCK